MEGIVIDEGKILAAPICDEWKEMWRSTSEIMDLMDQWYADYLENPTRQDRVSLIDKYICLGMISTIWNPVNKRAWDMAYKLSAMPMPEA